MVFKVLSLSPVSVSSFTDRQVRASVSSPDVDYCQNRLLSHYKWFFGKTFEAFLKRKYLKWLDAGCGKAYALRGFVRSNFTSFKGVLTGVTLQKPSAWDDDDDRVCRYFSASGLFAFYEADILSMKDLRTQNMITDVYGPISYSQKLDAVMQFYLDHLKADGVLFILLCDRQISIFERGVLFPFHLWLHSHAIEMRIRCRTVSLNRHETVIQISKVKGVDSVLFPKLSLLTYVPFGGALGPAKAAPWIRYHCVSTPSTELCFGPKGSVPIIDSDASDAVF